MMTVSGYYAKLVLGVVSGIVSLMWLLHIALYVFPRRYGRCSWTIFSWRWTRRGVCSGRLVSALLLFTSSCASSKGT